MSHGLYLLLIVLMMAWGLAAADDTTDSEAIEPGVEPGCLLSRPIADGDGRKAFDWAEWLKLARLSLESTVTE